MVSNLAKVIPTVQAVSLVNYNVSKAKKKNVSVNDILNLGVTNVVGLGLITKTASITGSIQNVT